MPAELHTWRGERAHLGRWRDLDGVGVIATRPGDIAPTPGFVEHCCAWLRSAGYHVVVTPALTPGEIGPYVKAGFVLRERLHVLVHDLASPLGRIRSVRTPQGLTFGRARPADLEATLDVDRAAFDGFWRFDRDALTEACTATPQSRFRVAFVDGAGAGPWRQLGYAEGDIVGYCITGRSRYQGFLQRLAVAPGAQGRGLGRELVWDAVKWLGRRRVRSCVVNTQESNVRARELYETCGFVLAPSGLHVLTRDLTTHPDAASTDQRLSSAAWIDYGRQGAATLSPEPSRDPLR